METEKSNDNLKLELNRRTLPNAFDLFCQKHRPILKEKFPSDDDRSIILKLEEYWDVLEAKDKSVYTNLANDLMEHHAALDKNMQNQRRAKNIIENSNNLSAAVVLAAASPIAPCWQKQRGQQSTWQPSPFLTKNIQQPQVQSSQPDSRNSSGSSSPEPSPNPSLGIASVTEAAPRKMFKQRYLANEQTNQLTLSDSPGEQESNACEALLQLANAASRQAVVNLVKSSSNTRSNSGTSSPKDSNDSSGPPPKSQGMEFNSLRDAVWSRVAQTILTQEKEKGNGYSSTDEPINLSNQCTIRGQTIIEHIIENILDEPMQPDVANCNGSSNSNSQDSTDQIKDIIYQGLKDDIKNRAANNIQDGFKGRHALWNRLPNPRGPGPIPTTISNEAALQLLPTVPVPFDKEMAGNGSVQLIGDPSDQQAEVKTLTLTGSLGPTLDVVASNASSEQQLEGEDQGKKGKKINGQHNSDLRSPGKPNPPDGAPDRQLPTLHKRAQSPRFYRYNSRNEQISIVYSERPVPAQQSRPAPKQTKSQRPKPKPHNFDVEQQLSAIPAFDLELFQQKMLTHSSGVASTSLPSKRPASYSENLTTSPKKKV